MSQQTRRERNEGIIAAYLGGEKICAIAERLGITRSYVGQIVRRAAAFAPRNQTKIVAVSESGHYLGEDHHRALLTDEEVETIRQLNDPEYTLRPVSQRMIARWFGIPHSTVGDICACRRRASTPATHKRAFARPRAS